jgi:hypothetical protein
MPRRPSKGIGAFGIEGSPLNRQDIEDHCKSRTQLGPYHFRAFTFSPIDQAAIAAKPSAQREATAARLMAWIRSCSIIAHSPSPSSHLQLFQPNFSQNYLQLSGT